MNTQGQAERGSALAVSDLARVALADSDAAQAAREGGVGLGHAECLQIAKTIAIRKLCNLREDRRFPFLQNAKMEFPEFPNENFVAAWRDRRGMTQQQLADAIGTTGSVVSLLESGDRQLTPKWLRRIASAFGVPTGYLLEHHPDNLPADVVEVWARLPDEKKADAMRMLEALASKRTGTEG